MTTGETLSLTGAEAPLLLFKVGAPGDTPEDFPSELAREFDFTYIDRDMTRELMIATPAYRAYKSMYAIPSLAVRGTMHSFVADLLSGDTDVMLNAHYNSERSRTTLKNHTVQTSGALMVAMCFETDEDIARERVALQVLEAREAGSDQYKDDSLDIVARARSTMVSPKISEPSIDFILRLNGSVSTDDMLAQAEQQFADYGLLG